MDISYNWLKDLLDTDLGPKEMAENLTRVGNAVEGIHEHGDDFVFDIDLTSNRGDCLSHLGIARELSVFANCNLRFAIGSDTTAETTADSDLVQVEAPDLCHRFTARIIRGVKIGPSPEWLVKRLEAVGERSINNVADITNYVMHELGQPMHSFDLGKLAGGKIIVRRAKHGEKITTLDDVERTLDESMLAICDAEKPAAIGGVMGGAHSGITDETTDVLLEVAYFRRDSIRQTSRRLKLSTEASHRFERGVDIENLIRASNRATKLICELAGGTAGEFVDVYPTNAVPKTIESKDIAVAVTRLTGLNVTLEDITDILSKLGINSKPGTRNSKLFTAPTWRHDLNIEEDLVEEIARIVGYENIGEELPPAFGAGEFQPNEMRKFHLRQTLAGAGFDEALSYSFIDSKYDDAVAVIPGFADESLEEKFVTLQDSIIEGAVRMRPTLVPGLLEAVRTNFNFQNRNLRLFEIGKCFAADGERGLPRERELLALVMTGGETFEHRAMTGREYDFFDAKGALELALGAAHAPALSFRAADIRHLRKGQSAEILLGEHVVGMIGRISDDLAQGFKFRQPVFMAEVDLQTVLAEPEPTILYRPLPVYPAIERDVSLLVKRTVNFESVRDCVANGGFELVRNVEFVDIFEGKGVADDERSLTIRLVYRSDERTLVESEVESVHAAVLQQLGEKFDSRRRF